MRIGRLEFGFNDGLYWGYVKGSCECRMLELGPIYILWSAKDCKCSLCNKYTCVCMCLLCKKRYITCDCEDFK